MVICGYRPHLRADLQDSIICSTFTFLLILSKVDWFADSMPKSISRKPALFISLYSASERAPKRILQSRWTLRLYPRCIKPSQKSLSQPPTGKLPESSIISFTAYFPINSPISSRTLFTERPRKVPYIVGQLQNVHLAHQQSRADII